MNRRAWVLSLWLLCFCWTMCWPGRAVVAGEPPTATLKMTFKYKGVVPEPRFVQTPPKLLAAFPAPIPMEDLVVDPKSSGIKDVIVYAYTGRRAPRGVLPIVPAKPRVHKLLAQNGRFDPHVLILRAGDSVQFVNRDPVQYNVNYSFFKNPALGILIPPPGNHTRKVTYSEPAPIPVTCNIYGWMSARLVVLDHPYAAKTNKDGILEIKGLPVGNELVFRANHESAHFQEVIVNGEPEQWRSNRFSITLRPGVNELNVEMPASAFDP